MASDRHKRPPPGLATKDRGVPAEGRPHESTHTVLTVAGNVQLPGAAGIGPHRSVD
jgi:hypothetical protein